MARADQPSIVKFLAPIFAEVPRVNQPILTALAERIAAKRYRLWAGEIDGPQARRQPLACADREEGIAQRVEALYHGASALQRELAESHPDLEERYAALFTGTPLAEQFARQADAERAGAVTWQAFAAEQEDPSTAEAFRSCALLEAENAAVLEDLIASESAGA